MAMIYEWALNFKAPLTMARLFRSLGASRYSTQATRRRLGSATGDGGIIIDPCPCTETKAHSPNTTAPQVTERRRSLS
jgi:hypothetical protein